MKVTDAIWEKRNIGLNTIEIEVSESDTWDELKKEIEKDISLDFSLGYEGVKQLPKKARLGVYLAYVYYFKLFNKIINSSPETLMNKRIRIPNNKKFRLLLSSFVRHNLNSL